MIVNKTTDSAVPVTDVMKLGFETVLFWQ